MRTAIEVVLEVGGGLKQRRRAFLKYERPSVCMHEVEYHRWTLSCTLSHTLVRMCDPVQAEHKPVAAEVIVHNHPSGLEGCQGNMKQCSLHGKQMAAIACGNECLP